MAQTLLLGEIGPAGTVATVFEDTFTDTNGVDLDDHTSDTPASKWQASGGNLAEVQSNKAVDINGQSSTITMKHSAAIADGVASQFELYVDVTRGAGVTVTNATFNLLFQADSAASSEYCYVGFNVNVTTSIVSILRDRIQAGASKDLGAITNSFASLAAGSSIRLGVTINGLNVTAWTEPVGGGTRTIHGSWTWTTVGFDVTDGSHEHLGIQYDQPGAAGAHDWSWDNIKGVEGTAIGSGGEIYQLDEESYGQDVATPILFVEETQDYFRLGRGGRMNYRKAYIPIAYSGACKLMITPITDYHLRLPATIQAFPHPSKRREATIEVPIAKHGTGIRFRIEVLERSGRVEVFTPDYAFVAMSAAGDTVIGVD